MASLIVRKLDASVVTLDDIGLSITGPLNTTFDLLGEQAADISLSTDLVAAIGTTLEVLDPRDGTTVLSTPDGILVIQNHNLSHFGIQGGRFSALDAPGFNPTDNFLVEFDAGSATMVQIDPAIVVSNNSDSVASIVGDMFANGSDTTAVYSPNTTPIVAQQDETAYDGSAPNGSFVAGDGVGGTAYAPGDTITMSDGSVITVDSVDGNGDVTDFTVTTNGGNVTAGVAVTQTSTSGTGTAFEITPTNANIQQGEVQINVNDSFLRNDGDTLDSGTLNIASGASLTIQDAPVNPLDAVNKAYADSLASGLDPKESVRAATTPAIGDLGFTFVNNGGVGDTLTAGIAGSTIIDTVALVDGDRVLIKDQTDSTQNGIYVVSDAGAGTATVFTRAEDQDGSSASEVSAGNYAFVEQGTNANSGWVVSGDGILTVNTDNIIWTQFSSAGSFVNGAGIALTGNVFSLDINTVATDTIASADHIAFNDVSESNVSNKTTVANFLTDLNIVNNLGGNGFAVQTASGTFASRTILINGVGPLDGIAITNGDGVSGNPVVGLDIQNMPIQTAIDSADRIPVWDSTANANVYYTVGDVAGALSSVNSFATWSAAGNSTGDASIIADSATDTVTFTGGIGNSIDFNATGDTLTFNFTRDGMADTAVVSGDTVAFFDTSNSNEAEFRSFGDLLDDLNVPNNIGSGTGMVIKTGDSPDTYTTRSVVASTTAAQQGAVIVNGDGVSGNIAVGVDINGQTDSGDDLAATDEILAYDGTNNVSMSGQQVATGVSSILGIDGITISTINGQPVLTITDTTRSNKQLSVDSSVYSFGENLLGHLDWIRPVGSASDADSGYIMPLNGTIVFSTAHCENTSTDDKNLHIFVNGVDQGSVGTLSGGANVTYVNTTLNLDFAAGDRIRMQSVGSSSGTIADTVANFHVRWRA